MNRFLKAAFVLFLLAALPVKHWAQQPRLIKVSEFSIHDIKTIEERVFLIHSIHEKGYYCYKSLNKVNTVEVYMAEDASEELSDFDFFLDDLYLNELPDFGYLDKFTRGELFVQWRYELDDEMYKLLYEDFTRGVRADNATCETALPFCTNNGLYNFPAGVDAGSPCNGSCDDPYHCTSGDGHQGQDNCLSTAPNPAFYYMRIDEPGNLNIYMYSTPSHDIDFDCWGPFDDINSACDLLSCSNMVDCSYDPSSTEHCHINNAQHGQFYILLITNYSNQPCNINFENIGTGSTDCSILPPLVDNDGPYCVGSNINLTANGQMGSTYVWTGPNNFSSTIQNPIIENCTLGDAGDYTCTITLNGESSSATTEIVIYPMPTTDFTFTTVCEGETTQFNSTATNNPSGQDIEVYEWDFGDGETGSGQTVTHTYAQAGTYQVTHTTSNGEGLCTDEKTMSVVVNAMPIPTATANPTSVQYSGVSTISANAGVGGTFTYHWEPSNMVTDPDSQTTQTVPLIESQTYTVTVTNTQGGCTSTTQVTVVMAGSDMTATATADEYEICENGSTTLHALPIAGTGNYTFNWTPANTLSNSNVQHPVATPPVGTTTYSCHVSDGIVDQDVSVTIVVHPNEETDIYDTICDNETYSFHGQIISATGVYPHTLQTIHHCDSLVRLHLKVNDTKTDEITLRDSCDVATLDWFGNIVSFTRDCDSVLTGETPEGCLWERTVHVRDMKFTPVPVIKSTDDYVDAPHYPITATEFNVNLYTYKASDPSSDATWIDEQCEWAISHETWRIEPSADNRSCTVYAMEWVEDTIWLSFKAVSECTGELGVVARYWLKPSFYGIDDNEAYPAAVDIIPNPNNGHMQLMFNNMIGNMSVKVYTLTGILVDSFEVSTTLSGVTYDYVGDRLSNGIYFFNISDGKRNVTKKVVINN